VGVALRGGGGKGGGGDGGGGKGLELMSTATSFYSPADRLDAAAAAAAANITATTTNYFSTADASTAGCTAGGIGCERG
jgi:hypothetical protein